MKIITIRIIITVKDNDQVVYTSHKCPRYFRTFLVPFNISSKEAEYLQRIFSLITDSIYYNNSRDRQWVPA